jgi:leader peptidase (prepilin peptidase) / N-methyltransferase
MNLTLSAFVIVFGAVIGSFLNAVLWRLHSGESLARGRSLCPHCRHALAPLDLVPILSWLALGGRCRYCRAGIGASYLWIEVATAALFWLAAVEALPALAAGGSIEPRELARLLLDWYLLATLLVVFVFDLRHMLILRVVTTPATLIALAGSWALGVSPASLAIGAAFGGGFFWLQHALSRGRWVGGGDVHLGLLMGVMLGGARTVAAVMLAYMAGALYAVYLLATKRASGKTEIPFGTFLSAGAAVMLLYGDAILNWYFGFL